MKPFHDFHETRSSSSCFCWFALCSSGTADAQVRFRDITKQAGINFVHNNGATGKKWLPETMGPGCAFIDYDNDGYPDILLVNGQDWNCVRPALDAEALPQQPQRDVYRRDGEGGAGGQHVRSWRCGRGLRQRRLRRHFRHCARPEPSVSQQRKRHLHRCDPQPAGLWGPNEFSTSAAWVDYDRDGKLDLVVANYVQWTPQSDIYCTLDGTTKSYCTPESYKGASLRLWHNLGNGKFEDATAKAGLLDNTSKSLGLGGA